MIIGLGEDLVDIDRIQKLIDNKGDAFLKKCFTPFEIEIADKNKTGHHYTSYFAKRFAAKEACLKALGTGMREGLSWQDMSVGNDDLGRPILNICGGVDKRLKTLTPVGHIPILHITLSDEANLAKATVILEAIPLDKSKLTL
jgi:holo-[acyl-carrier protein] synthase